MARGSSPEAGFTLIEVLVALVVSALLLGIIMTGVGQASERANRSAARREAVHLASSVLAERSAATQVEGQAKGQVGRVIWLSDERIIDRDPRGFFVLSEIKLTFSDVRGKSLYTLIGRKIKAAPKL